MLKKIFTSVVLILLVLGIYSQKTQNKKTQINQHIFFKGKLVDITIDKILYQSSSYGSFLSKITIKNNTSEELGVDLNNYWKVIYPNQYGIYPSPERNVIDEERIIPDTLTNKKKESLKKDFASNKLKKIPANGKIEYYRDFNDGKKEKLMTKKGEFLIISFDGQLFITNGRDKFEHVCSNEKNNLKTDLIIEYPVVWENISNKDEIIKKP